MRARRLRVGRSAATRGPDRGALAGHGRRRDAEVVAAAAGVVDVVVHAAAALPLYAPEEIRTVDVGGTRTALEAAQARGVRRVVGFPAGPAILALKLLERLGLSPLYPWVYETAARDSFVATDRIEARLGFAPRWSNRAALVRNFD